jgi:hypothetical protein
VIFAASTARAVLRGEVTQARRPVQAREPYYRKTSKLKSTGRSMILVQPYKPKEGDRFPIQHRVTVDGKPSATTQGHGIITSAIITKAGDLAFQDARQMGYRTTSEAMAAWLTEYDQAWVREPNAECQACGGPGLDPAGFCVTCGCDDQPAARFTRKHAERDVWVIHFELDRSHESRLLAALPAGEGDHDGDYVSSPSRAMGGEADPGEAVDAKTTADYAREGHQGWVAREASRQADRDRMALEERLRLVRVEARAQGVDVHRVERSILQRIRAMEMKVKQQGKRAA